MALRILIRGAGDLATGVAAELKERGYQIVMTEIEVPLTVRRQVACSRAVYEGKAVIEGHTALLVSNENEAEAALQKNQIAVLTDPAGEIRTKMHFDVIVDAIMAKKNLGTSMTDGPCVIALGPGFTAGYDCHAVIETKRGLTLGQPIYEGRAIPNTGVPGMVGGCAIERLIKASADGIMEPVAEIGDVVRKGELLAVTGGHPVYAQIDGIIRGMLQTGVEITKGMKIGDVDPRMEPSLVHMISDKARKIGKGVAQAIRTILFSQYGMVFLAAGSSRRYGEAKENKLLAEKNGKPMFRYLLDQMEVFSMCTRTVVSRIPQILDYAQGHGMLTTENTEPEKGISLSLKMGIETCRKQNPQLQGILFAVCDQPGLKAQTIEQMLELAVKNPEKIICAGTKDCLGNPVLLDKRYFPELMELKGDTGGKQVVKKHLDQVVLCETSSQELQDIDEKTQNW